MSHRFFSKIISIAAAAVIGFTSFCYSGGEALRDSAAAAQITAESVGEPVSVLVSLNSDALLENIAPDDLGSDDAEQQKARIRRAQARTEQSIRSLYPALEITQRYETLINGFACKLPESLLESVRALPLVKYAELEPEITVPHMAKAAETVGIPVFREETGVRGEGQVIAVIDSELDLSHPMFAPLPDGIKTPLTKADISRLADANELAFDIDAEKAYRSSKVPYAVNYTQDDYRYVTAFENNYHGTHVSGIAAGRPFTDSDGTVLSGVAPDAQLLFFCCGTAESDGIIIQAALTAIEDAVKLKADVINLSFGIPGTTPLFVFTDAINAAENAGVTVCISAGNEDNGTYSEGIQPTVERLDNCRLNALISDDTRALSVGAVDNPTEVTLKTILFGGQKIGYTSCFSSTTGDECYLGDTLKENTGYEYVFCGRGMEDIGAQDLTGKLALMDRGFYTFTEKAQSAYFHGAVGVIIVQNSDGQPKGMINDAPIPVAMITKAEGELLKNAAVKTVRFSSETQTMRNDLTVSSFSSWGVRESLAIRPDIAGIGGGVRSAAYRGRSSVQDGTSMSSPFVAGCAALLNTVLEEQGCTLTGSDRAKRLRQMLMSSAEPVRDDGMLTSPRQQGAGLVSAQNMIRDSVLITGDGGECKRSLGDRLGQEFSFVVTLTNLSDQPVMFAQAAIELTTDGVLDALPNGISKIGGQQKIRCNADLEGMFAPIPPGESRTETVTVTLNRSDYAALTAQFPFGFFVDGFLLLSGAENCCDISMPLVGFAGDWTALPLMDGESLISGQTMVSTFDSTQPLSEIIDRAGTILEGSGLSGDQSDIFDHAMYLIDNASEADYEWLQKGSGNTFISPNGDFLADHVGIGFEAYRPLKYAGNNLYDSSGKLLQSVTPELQFTLSSSVFDLSKLPEGDYSYEALLTVKDMIREAEPQSYRFPFTIDNTKPVLESAVHEENGRKILSMTASDANLDGILVLATGKGGLSGKYNPDTALQDGLKQRAAIMSAISWKAIGLAGSVGGYDFSAAHPLPEDILHGYIPSYFMDDELCFFDWLTPEEGSTTLSADYDITDFTEYWFVALDRAYNYDVFPYGKPILPLIEPGRYIGSKGIYDFTETTLTFLSFYDYYPMTFDYTLELGELTLVKFPSMYYFTVRKTDDDRIILRGQMKQAFYLGEEEDEDVLRKLSPQEYGDYTLGFPTIQLEKPKLALLTYAYLEEHFGEIPPFDTKISFEQEAVEVYGVYPVNDSWEIDAEAEPFLTIRVDLRTGIASLPDGSEQQLFRPFHGDYDGDLTFSIADAILLARYNSEEAGIHITRPYDLDGNGTLDAGDLNVLLEYLATEDWEGVSVVD